MAEDGQDLEITASHQALSVVGVTESQSTSYGTLRTRPWLLVSLLLSLLRPQVAGWLGMSAEDALEETGAAADELFEKPRPNL